MRIWRVEHGTRRSGMWYDENGNWSPFILTLSEGKSKDLPMDDHERYRTGGKRWYSGCSPKELIKYWFTQRDVEELMAAGYKLYELEVDEFMVEEFQVLYTVEGLTKRTELSLRDVWNEII